MYAIIKLGNQVYSKDLSDMDEYDRNDYIEDFVNQGTPVTICDEVQDVYDIFGDDIKNVEG